MHTFLLIIFQKLLALYTHTPGTKVTDDTRFTNKGSTPSGDEICLGFFFIF